MPNLITSDVDTQYVMIAAAGQTTFPVNFPVFEAGDLDVYVNGVLATNSGLADSALEYQVTGVGNPTCAIVFGAPQPINTRITVVRDVPIRRSIDIPTTGPFASEIIDDEFDRIFAIAQQLKTDQDLAIRMPFGEEGYRIPNAATRKNKLIGFDSNGVPFVTTAPVGPMGPAGSLVTNGFEVVTLQQFGGVADDSEQGAYNGTDNLPAWNAMVAYLESKAIKYLPDSPRYQALPTLRIPAGRYYFSDTLNLKVGSFHIVCENGVRFRFPADTHGMIIHGHDTIESGIDPVPFTYQAAGTRIVGLSLQGSGGTRGTAHGFWLRASAYLEQCGVSNFSGNGFNIVADIGGSGVGRGNANGWRLMNCGAQRCGDHGIYVQGGDVNAGMAVGYDSQYNAGFGVFDRSFLGNTWIGGHTDANGLAEGVSGPNGFRSYTPALVTHNNAQWTPRLGYEVQASTEAPGTGLAWLLVRGGGATGAGMPAWVSGTTYRTGGGHATNHIDNLGQRSVFISNYEEGNSATSQIFPNSIVIGGFQQNMIAGKLEQFNDKMVAPQIGSLGSNSDGKDVASYLAAGGDGNYPNDTILWRVSIDSDNKWGQFYRNANHYAFRQNSGNYLVPPYRITTTETTETFARATPVPGVFAVPSLGIGFGNRSRILGMCTRAEGAAEIAAGAASPLAEGERYFYFDPVAGGREGIVRTTTGVKEFGSIAP